MARTLTAEETLCLGGRSSPGIVVRDARGAFRGALTKLTSGPVPREIRCALRKKGYDHVWQTIHEVGIGIEKKSQTGEWIRMVESILPDNRGALLAFIKAQECGVQEIGAAKTTYRQ